MPARQALPSEPGPHRGRIQLTEPPRNPGRFMPCGRRCSPPCTAAPRMSPCDLVEQLFGLGSRCAGGDAVPWTGGLDWRRDRRQGLAWVLWLDNTGSGHTVKRGWFPVVVFALREERHRRLERRSLAVTGAENADNDPGCSDAVAEAQRLGRSSACPRRVRFGRCSTYPRTYRGTMPRSTGVRVRAASPSRRRSALQPSLSLLDRRRSLGSSRR
jgi:hypothetical protein